MEKTNNKMEACRGRSHSKCDAQAASRRKVATGIALVSAGVLLILGRIGIIPGEYMDYIFCWQSLLIVLGLVGLANGRQSVIFSILLVFTGGFFLATSIYDVPLQAQRLFLPTALVIVGLLVIFKPKSHDKWKQKFKNGEHINQGVFKRDYVFGGGKSIITAKDFSGGRVSVIFGGCELDFTEAELNEGINVLEVRAVFGGVDIKVPKHWNVEIDIKGVLGGFSDERRYFNPDELDTTRTLVLKGNAVFGGGELNNL